MQKGYWATAHFQFALGHDTTICIVTKGWVGWPGRATGAGMVGHDTAHDKQREATIRPAACACGLAGGEFRDTKFCIMIGART